MIVSGPSTSILPAFGREFLSEKLPRRDDQAAENKEIFRYRTTLNSTESDEESDYEELYARENYVILSRNGQTQLRSFVLDFQVVDLLWCTFPNDDDRGRGQSGSAATKNFLSTICVMGKQNLNVYRLESGSDMYLTLPFEVNRAFETKFGLFLERSLFFHEEKGNRTTDEESPFPFFFSLSHPMNEVLPVIYKPADKRGSQANFAKYTTNCNLQIVHVDFKHSLLICYDRKQNLHSLWLIRKATNDDALSAAKLLEQSINLHNSALIMGGGGGGGAVAPSNNTPSVVRSNVSLLLSHVRSGETPLLHHTSTATGSQSISRTNDPIRAACATSSASNSHWSSTNPSSSMSLFGQSTSSASQQHQSAAAAHLAPPPHGHQPFSSSINQSQQAKFTTTGQSSSLFSPSLGSASFSLLAGPSHNTPVAATAPFSNTAIGRPHVTYGQLGTSTTTNRGGATTQTKASDKQQQMMISPAVSRILGLIRQKVPPQISNSPLSNLATPSLRSTPRHPKSRLMQTPANASNNLAGLDLTTTDCSQYWPAEPLIPDICIDHLWTESLAACDSQKMSHFGECKASKAFVCEDFMGQKFICYFVPKRQQLRYLKLSTNGEQPLFKVSPTTDSMISCKDATICGKSQILVILDTNNDILLYTGATKLCYFQLNLSNITQINPNLSTTDIVGSTAGDTFSLYSSSTPAFNRVVSNPLQTSGSKTTTTMLHHNVPVFSPLLENFASQNDRCEITPSNTSRNSLLLTGRTRFVCKLDEFCQRSSSFLATLNDEKSSRLKIEAPKLLKNSDFLLEICTNSLNFILPKEKSIDFFVGFYTKSNFTPPIDCRHQNSSSSNSIDKKSIDLKLFLKCLSEFVGFDSSNMQIFEELSEETAATPSYFSAKKRKISDSEGSEADWQYLLNSRANMRQHSHIFPDANFHADDENSESSAAPAAAIVYSSPTKYATTKFAAAAAANSAANFGKNLQQNTSQTNNLHKLRSDNSLFAHLPSIFYNLHCCYENLKIFSKFCDDRLKILAEFLHILACVMKLNSFIDLYERDFSNLIDTLPNFYIDEGDFKILQYPSYWTNKCWRIFDLVNNSIVNVDEKINNPNANTISVNPYCYQLWLICIFYALLFDRYKNGREICVRKIPATSNIQIDNFGGHVTTIFDEIQKRISPVLNDTTQNNVEKLKSIICELGRMEEFDEKFYFDLASLSPGLLLPLLECGEFLTVAADSSARNISPPDRNLHKFYANFLTKDEKNLSPENFNKTEEAAFKSNVPQQKYSNLLHNNDDDEDGMANVLTDEILHLRFSRRDLRLKDVRQYLRSNRPIKIHLKQQANQNDHEFREEQEHFLLANLLRTLMLPTGRGMLTLRSSNRLFGADFEPTNQRQRMGRGGGASSSGINQSASSSSTMPGGRIPKLCLTGKSAGQNFTIELTHIETPPAFDLWAQFHNGVAAGLKINPRVVPQADNNPGLLSAWILANVTRSGQNLNNNGSSSNANGGGGAANNLLLGAGPNNQMNNNNNLNINVNNTNNNPTGNVNNNTTNNPGGTNNGGTGTGGGNGTNSTGGTNNFLILQPDIAGFLLGLGLNGLLSNLALFNIHEYLCKGDPMTSIAILLGISASKAKSKDHGVMKILATHLPFLLPPTLLELNVDPQIQNAAVVGLGLLNAQSNNYRLAEALLKEMGQSSSSHTDHVTDRESYALSCGFALGLITLGKGNLTFNDPDFTLADELILLMNGGHKRPHHFVSSSSNQSNLIREGEFLNIHVTSLPATVALGLMYIKSNDRRAAEFLKPPDTLTLLDTVRPDFLLIRTVCRNLILWDSVMPSRDWVEDQLPEVLQKVAPLILQPDLTQFFNHFNFFYFDGFNNKNNNNTNTGTGNSCGPGTSGGTVGSATANFTATTTTFNDINATSIDFETVAQSYCYIVAGACFSLGFRFAGSANAECFAVLVHYYKLFMTNVQNAPVFAAILQKAGKYTVETCLNVIILSLGMVMASTGNLDVIRIVRHFRRRLSLGANYLVPHMALGLLFLGCGRYCLKTDDLSLAVMLIAFFPKFPLTTNDNRYHLQALRHLYVLACEPRVFMLRDDLDGELAYCNVKVRYKATKNYGATEISMKSPCILPELHLIDRLKIDDERYFSIFYESSKNWRDLENIVLHGEILTIRRRAGFETYKNDPLGYKSVVSRSLFKPPGSWSVSGSESKSKQLPKYGDLINYCLRNECWDALPFLIDLSERIFSANLSTYDVWQLKLIKNYLFFNRHQNSNTGTFRNSVVKKSTTNFRPVLPDEFILSLLLYLEEKLISEVDPNQLKLYIGKWVSNIDQSCLRKSYLGEFLTFFDLMPRDRWPDYQLRDYRHLRSFLEKLQSSEMPLNSIITLQRILYR